MEKHTYNLEKLKRLLNFPFRLKEIGWMPEHVYIHRQTLINRIFVCLTFNFKAGGISEVNGRLVHSSGKDHLGIIWPGTVLQTIQQESMTRFSLPMTPPAPKRSAILG